MFGWFKKKQAQSRNGAKQTELNRERELERQDFYDKGYILGWKGKAISPSERKSIFQGVRDRELHQKFDEGYKAGKKESEQNPFCG